ncbi:hypothetical protein GCM10023142_32200 [Anaerocolumna aminovalerica]|jgi:hypothetical protein|uniref:SAF domain-containing protein n=1 Tax=Anaerocolumna aminovalerica TaxID=1527 RepID=A0A1I5GDV1_9FIRM|nr:SAF domain-containing protein [Anaerocolumna aminovalerica]MDU6264531.1 SAF domain-containing protein [Anaerocolumna aminovalerica]SFO34268.1 hypothetical protein SAMN04489757_11914 [Anaerocolumna aminovalerica]
MIRRRLKRTPHRHVVIILVSLILIFIGLILFYFTIIKGIKNEYQHNIDVLKEQLEEKEIYVYEAKVDIPAGSQIKEEDLIYRVSCSDKPQKYFMTKEGIGMTVLMDIRAGTQVIKGMLTEDRVDSNLREVEYNIFYINNNVVQNDYVDVRIRFPNGEDYIVLSKKRILSPNIESFQCFLWLKEEEILSMSSAIVDAYLYSGTILYTTKYIEPNLQEESIPTYQPSLASLTLMEQDKNILDKASMEVNRQLRKAMENRLTEYMNLDISNVNWTLDKEMGQEISNRQEISNKELKVEAKEQKEYYITDTDEIQEDEKIIYGG